MKIECAASSVPVFNPQCICGLKYNQHLISNDGILCPNNKSSAYSFILDDEFEGFANTNQQKCLNCGRSWYDHNNVFCRDGSGGIYTLLIIPESPVDSTPTEEDLSTTPPKYVLNLVKDSKPEDWHRHSRASVGCKYGGWVYKTAKVSDTARLHSTAVVYDKADVRSNCIIHRKARIGKNAYVGSGSIIHPYSRVYGRLGSACVVYQHVLIRPDIVILAGTIVEYSRKKLRTQKARGVEALRTNHFDVPDVEIYRLEQMLKKENLPKLVNKFVRPCPQTPRHGFVDSRCVTTVEEAAEVVNATRTADRRAEFLVMPFIKASHSGIWTDGQIVIGEGNDGATAGKKSLTIPVQGILRNKHGQSITELYAAADIKESPYVEILWESSEDYLGSYGREPWYGTRFVQLRNGPKVPETTDFIPKKTVVNKVVLADGDLLEWEAKVKTFQEGTVVYHPGGSLASHYAVHCFLNNVPVMISRKPLKGETLEKDTSELKPDLARFRKGFFLGATKPMGYVQAVYLMLSGCHSTTKWLGKQDLLLGAAVGACYRLITTICLGEYRHKVTEGGVKLDRNTVYVGVWDKVFDKKSIEKFSKAAVSFDIDHWQGSVGGPRWYLVCLYGMLLLNAVLDEDIKECLGLLNKAVNCIHNNGWAFNKFLHSSKMDEISRSPLTGVIHIAPILYDMVMEKSYKPPNVTKFSKGLSNPVTYMEERRNRKAEVIKRCGPTQMCWNPPVVWMTTKGDSHLMFHLICEKHKPQYVNAGWTEAVLKFEHCPGHDIYSYGVCGGEENLYKVPGGAVFPVCKNHASKFVNLWSLSAEEMKKYPQDENGEEENAESCDCESHTCEDCYPNGCECANPDCHDCGDNHCDNCNPDHDFYHCYSCQGTEQFDCHDKGCEKCYPEQEEPKVSDTSGSKKKKAGTATV